MCDWRDHCVSGVTLWVGNGGVPRTSFPRALREPSPWEADIYIISIWVHLSSLDGASCPSVLSAVFCILCMLTFLGEGLVPDCPTKGCLHLTDNCVCAQSPSPAHLFATLWTVAHQAPLSLGFPRQEFWSGLAFPSPGDLPSPGVELSCPEPPESQEDPFPAEPLGKPRALSCKHLRASHAKPLLRLPWVIPGPGSRH